MLVSMVPRTFRFISVSVDKAVEVGMIRHPFLAVNTLVTRLTSVLWSLKHMWYQSAAIFRCVNIEGTLRVIEHVLGVLKVGCCLGVTRNRFVEFGLAG